MGRAFLKKDIELLGYSESKLLDSTEHYTIYEAIASAGLKSVSAIFVHLKSDFTIESAKEAARKFRPDYQKFIVIPKHHESRIPILKSTFRDEQEIYVYEELIWRSVSKTFSSYLHAIQEELPPMEWYVTPRPEGAPTESLHVIVEKWLAERSDNIRSRLLTILAAAGVGKTTLSREVVRNLAKTSDQNRVIPIYVEAAHWAEMLDTSNDLWGIIQNSLRHFCGDLQLTRAMFEHLLRSGDLVFVFDGFDELCGQRRHEFNAREVLRELLSLATESSARVMLTSRKVYWETEIGFDNSDVNIYTLAPFTKQQAMDYFERRFSRNKQMRSQALVLFDNIRKQNQPPSKGGGKNQILYHPFVVGLIASAVEYGVENVSAAVGSGAEMYEILKSLCTRESQRQHLTINAEGQLAVFEDIAVEFDGVFCEEDCIIAGMDDTDASKLKEHPLLTPDLTNGTLQFKYEFLPALFKARYIARIIKKDNTLPKKALLLMEKDASGNSIMMDHVCASYGELSSLEQIGITYRAIPHVQVGARSFLFHLVKALVNERAPNLSRRERTDQIFSAISGVDFSKQRTVNSLCISGAIENFDFRNTTFEKCVFCDVTFRDCEVDSSTIYRECHFNGEFEVVTNKQKEWGGVQLVSCSCGKSADLVWHELRANWKGSAEDLITEILQLGLSKFWKCGRVHMSITKSHWHRGTLGRYQHASGELLKALLKADVLREIEIGGVSEGGLALSAEAIGDLQRLMDNRQISGKVRHAFDELRTSLV